MSVKIIVGYLRLMQRVMQHYQLNLDHLAVPEELQVLFHQALNDDQQHDIEITQYALLMQYMQNHFDRPISLIFGEHVALQDVGLIGYLASTSFDLQQALAMLEQYYPLLYKQTNIETLNIIQSGQSIQLSWHTPCDTWRNFCELNLALLYQIADLMVQEQLISPKFVIFGYVPEFALYHYEKFFRCSVQIKAQQYGIQFPKQILTVKSNAADRELNQIFSTQAQYALQHSNTQAHTQQIFKQKILRLIEQGLKQTQPIQNYVATHCHCSVRTLQRQLKQHELNFQELLNEYRMQQSFIYLQQGKSLTEIAERLNYADQSAFARAFKRWTDGETPKQYLKALHFKSLNIKK